MQALVSDIAKLVKKAAKRKMVPAVRLNGTSDIAWEKIPVDGAENIMALFPGVQFYDYTAVPSRALSFARGEMPGNYALTLSRKESNHKAIALAIKAGANVSVVFSGELPAEYLGRPVINGDLSDLRFTDPRGVVVGLKAKGKARNDQSGFVVNSLN